MLKTVSNDKEYQCSLGNQALCPKFRTTPLSQDRVVADHFWICGNKILRTTLPKVWRGRSARVQVVTEIAILLSLEGAVGNLESSNLNRRKRAYEPYENIKIDKIGQPRGIPEEF